jgi:hypothetical protein
MKSDENNKEINNIENNNLENIENNLKQKLKEEIEKNEKLQKIIDEQIEQINIYKSKVKDTKTQSKFAENSSKNIQDSQNSKNIPKFLYSFNHVDKYNNNEGENISKTEENNNKSLEKEIQKNKDNNIYDNNENNNDNANNKNDIENNKEECTICLEEFKNKQILRKLKCGHMFHIKCIDKWLKIHKNCPNDKIEVEIPK